MGHVEEKIREREKMQKFSTCKTTNLLITKAKTKAKRMIVTTLMPGIDNSHCCYDTAVW